MQSPITFDRPWLLLLLPPLLAYFWLLARRSYAGLHPATQTLALAARSLVAVLLVFTLSGLHIVQRSDKLTTLFLLDVSRSVRPDQRAQSIDYIRNALGGKRSGDAAGVIVFGRSASLQDAPSESMQDLGDIHASVAGDATDISQALQLAGATFPAGKGRKIVILSDGNENRGDAAAEIDQLRSAGVRIDVAPTDLSQSGTVTPEALVDSVNLPARARKAAPFALRVVVSSTVAQSASLTLLRDGRPISRQQVALKQGKTALDFQNTVAQTGFHRYDAELTPAQDAVPENNHAYGYVSVLGRPRVLYITDTDVPSYDTLRREMAAQNIEIDIQPPGAIPASIPALAAYDAVVLSDVPAEEVGPDQMTALEEAVKDFGVGLGMVGGVNSYAAGGYNGTPIEATLPVRMDVKDKKRFPSVAVAMVIEDLEEPMNVNMSIEAAKATVNLLEPIDQVGVLDCNGTWRIPMQLVTDKRKIKAQMDSLTNMNDPPTYDPYLIEAGRVLAATHASIKHIIFLGDGDAMDPTASNIQSIHRLGISISTVATGADAQGIASLHALARLGGGQSYVAEQPQDLPRLLLKDQKNISTLRIIEKPFLPRYNPADTVITGIPFSTEPPLLGYNISTAKPGSTVALSSPDHNDPVFAYWRYGLGRTFAFTSDDRAHWAVQWLGWPGYARFWAQTLRWSLRSSSSSDFQAVVDNQNGKGHIAVDAFTQSGGFVNKAAMTARVVAPDLTVRQVPLSQTAPGRYEGAFDTDQTGAYMVNVRQGSASAPDTSHTGAAPAPSQTVGLVVPYSPEYRTLTPNLPLLTRLAEGTGGKLESSPAQVFRDAPSWVVGVRDLAPGLLLACALLFLVDIAIRRLAIRPQQMRETMTTGVDAAGARLAAYRQAQAARAPQISTPQMERLLERKTAARAQTTDERAGETATASPTTTRLLNRRAVRDAGDDNPFPHVASLRPRAGKTAPTPPKTVGEDPSAEDGYTNRLLDAKRRARNHDEK